MEKSLQEEAQKLKIFYYYEKELYMHERTQPQRV